MKRVSFEVAKAIKEAGYPQTKSIQCNYYYAIRKQEKAGQPYYYEGYLLSSDDIYDCDAYDDDYIDAPTYIDVWLWLWQVKGIHIDIVSSKLGTQMDIWDSEQHNIMGDNTVFYSSPEDAIEAAIKYLVDNKLLK